MASKKKSNAQIYLVALVVVLVLLAIGYFVTKDKETEPTPLAKIPGTTQSIVANQLIISGSRAEAENAARAYQGEIVRAYSALGSYSVEFPVESTTQLAQIYEALKAQKFQVSYNPVIEITGPGEPQ
jgi:hypothetical protein